MAIMDARLEFSDAASLATAAGNTILSDVLDLGAASPDIGRGEPIWCHVRVGTAAAGSASATLQCSVQHSSTGTGGWTDLITTSAQAVGDLEAGLRLVEQPLPASMERYLRCAYAVAVSAISGGSVDAWLDLGTQ